jgi:hypothetical protein
MKLFLVLLSVTAALSACGGGGSSGAADITTTHEVSQACFAIPATLKLGESNIIADCSTGIRDTQAAIALGEPTGDLLQLEYKWSTGAGGGPVVPNANGVRQLHITPGDTTVSIHYCLYRPTWVQKGVTFENKIINCQDAVVTAK